MRRNEQRVPKIAPPIIATANAAIGPTGMALASSSPVSMVRRSTALDIMPSPIETRAKIRSRVKNNLQQQQNIVLENNYKRNHGDEYIKNGSSSRRKRFRPMRVNIKILTDL
jgi:hypothetical protein